MQNNKIFYKSNFAIKIMDPHHYDVNIKAFLRSEHEMILEIARNSQYHGIIEFGCGSGAKFQSFIAEGYTVYGVDINKNAIVHASKQLNRKFVNKLFLYHTSLEKFLCNLPPECRGKKLLTIFPFNLIGNLGNIRSLIKKILNINSDIFISSFKTNDFTTELRHKYYQNCGLSKLEIFKTSSSVLFTSSEGLKSHAYELAHFESILQPYSLASLIKQIVYIENIGYFIHILLENFHETI